VFVQRRLQHLAEVTEVRVVAPSAIVQYGNPKGQRIRVGVGHCPAVQCDAGIPVTRPRWFYPPFGGSLTAAWLFLQLLYPLARLRREFPFDVIDTHFGHPTGITGALLSRVFGVPFTMTLRGNEPNHSRSALGRYCMSFALRNAIRVFTVSERLRQFAIGLGADAAKVKTVPNGVDAEIFFLRDSLTCRQKYGLSIDRPLVLSAGALIERKGHHRIIQALKAISTATNSPQLAIVGGPGPEGQYEQNLRQLVVALDLSKTVRFLGVLNPEEMAEVMSAADVFCLASTNEGWPNVVHEALACGTPVIATDVGAVPDMLAAGKYGLVIPVNDPSALENALATALQRGWNRSEISAWGRSRSWHQVAREVLAEMQAIVESDQTKGVRE
jgi:glycosyltransferase involved in cell wall biosynthesis